MMLVRHAESEWNHHFSRTRIDPGIPDPPLTQAGRRQAARLVDRLAEAEIRRLVASPYRRTLETATIVGEALGLSITVEPLIRERCVFSCDEGTPPGQLAALWPGLDFAHLEEGWWGVPAESEVSLGRRCAAFRAKTDALPNRSRIAVITHWGVIRALTGQELSNAECIRLI
jgi:glucosyl-3-phosphoglycerate phosphatase